MSKNTISKNFRVVWLQNAARLPGKSLHVAFALLCSTGFGGSQVAELSNRRAANFGVDRNGKYRALAWLEEADLVQVTRKLGRSPVVRILCVGEDE